MAAATREIVDDVGGSASNGAGAQQRGDGARRRRLTTMLPGAQT